MLTLREKLTVIKALDESIAKWWETFAEFSVEIGSPEHKSYDEMIELKRKIVSSINSDLGDSDEQ